MNKFFLLLVASVFAFSGCTDAPVESDFTVKISGTSGLVTDTTGLEFADTGGLQWTGTRSGVEFGGSCMAVKAGGSTTSTTVQGVAPAEYSVRGTIVSCALQKKTKRGNLRVEIIKGDKIVSESETTAEYGVVSVATR